MRYAWWIRLRCAAAVAAVFLALPAASRAADVDGEAVTASGEVVDLACYFPRGDKGRGAGHEECAEMCAKGGAPLGLLAADGSLLLLVEDHSKPAPYGEVRKLAGKQAEVQGKKFTRAGVAALVVDSAKGL